MSVDKKLHWTQRPGGRERMRQIQLVLHKRKRKGSKAERIIKAATANGTAPRRTGADTYTVRVLAYGEGLEVSTHRIVSWGQLVDLLTGFAGRAIEEVTLTRRER